MPAPVSADLAPALAGILGGGGLFLGAVIRGWINGKKPDSQTSHDAVVVSGAFADSKPIADLARAVGEDADATRELVEVVTSFARSQALRSNELREAVEAMHRAQERTNGLLEGIGDGMSKGVTVKIAPGG